MAELAVPEGIDTRDVHPTGRLGMGSVPLGPIGLVVLLMLSLLGLFGKEAQLEESSNGAALAVHAPAVIRNGEFFEMTITIEVDRSVADVVLLVDEDVWRDVTVNTFIPAAAEESFADGAWSFSFGPLDAGQRLVLKVDCQINPDHQPAANHGRIAVADGDAVLASVEHAMQVLP